MKRLSVLALLAAVAVLGMTVESQASGRRHGGCNSCCDSPCVTSCAAPCYAPAPVQYEERKVTCYKQVMVEKDVEVLVCRQVWTDEKYSYPECIPVTRQEKRIQVCCTPVTKVVDYTYTIMVPKCVQKTIQCTSYQCVQEYVKECVPVCRLVRTCCVDECGRCHTRCERVTVMEERTRCITRRIPVVTDRVVNVTVCEPQVCQGKRTICDYVRTEKEIIVDVCSYDRVMKEGVRKVCSTVTEKVIRKVSYCTTVPYEEVIKVAVCPTTCYSSCNDCSYGVSYGHRGHGCCR